MIQKNILKGLEGQETDSIVHETLSDLRVEKTAKVISETEEKLYQIKFAPGKQIGYITGNIKDICNVDVLEHKFSHDDRVVD
jgi:hypothetical protein